MLTRRRTLVTAGVVAALVALAVLTATWKPGRDGTGGTPESSADQNLRAFERLRARVADLPDPCRRVPRARVESLLGGPVVPQASTELVSRSCRWRRGSTSLQVWVYVDASAVSGLLRQGTPVPVGDEGRMIAGVTSSEGRDPRTQRSVVVRAADRAVTLTFIGPGAPNQAPELVGLTQASLRTLR